MFSRGRPGRTRLSQYYIPAFWLSQPDILLIVEHASQRQEQEQVKIMDDRSAM